MDAGRDRDSFADSKDSSGFLAEPISLSEDAHANITVSSRFVAVPLAEFVHTVQAKDVEEVLETHEDAEVMVRTPVLLGVSRAKDADADRWWRHWWAAPALLGLLAGGFLALGLAGEELSVWFPSAAFGLVGVSAGLGAREALRLWQEGSAAEPKAGKQAVQAEHSPRPRGRRSAGAAATARRRSR